MNTYLLALLLLWAKECCATDLDTYVDVEAFNSTDEALIAFNTSVLDGNQTTYLAAIEFLKQNFSDTLRSSVLNSLHYYAILDLTGKNWIVEEIEVFKAVDSWLKANPAIDEEFKSQLLRNVRLVAMNPDQLNEIVHPSDRYELEQIVETMNIKINHLDNENYERFPNQLARSNVLLKSLGAAALTPDCEELFDDEKYDDLAEKCSIKSTLANEDYGLVVRLGAGMTLNTIEFEAYNHMDMFIFEVLGNSNWATVYQLDGDTAYKGTIFNFDSRSVQSIRLKAVSRHYEYASIKTFNAYYKRCQ